MNVKNNQKQKTMSDIKRKNKNMLENMCQNMLKTDFKSFFQNLDFDIPNPWESCNPFEFKDDLMNFVAHLN